MTKPSLCQKQTTLVKTPPIAAFSVCETDNMNSNATNKTRTGPKRVRTLEPEDEQETPKSPPCSTPSSPAKAAKDALELAVASLPTSLQPLILHLAIKSLLPSANDMPRSRSCNEWNRIQATYHTPPRQ